MSMYKTPKATKDEQIHSLAAQVGALTADLQQARAFRDECERQYQEKVAEVYALTVERDAARRDIGRLARALREAKRLCRSTRYGPREALLRIIELVDKTNAAAATTPTADPRDTANRCPNCQKVHTWSTTVPTVNYCRQCGHEWQGLYSAAATPARGDS